MSLKYFFEILNERIHNLHLPKLNINFKVSSLTKSPNFKILFLPNK